MLGDLNALRKRAQMVAPKSRCPTGKRSAAERGILTHYLPLYFPEAERFHCSSRTDWFLAFLEQYATPSMITVMNRDAFIADAWQVVGRKVSKEHLLSDIYATAVDSVGLLAHPNSDAVRMFRPVLAEARSLALQRDEISAFAVQLPAGQWMRDGWL